MTRDIRAIVYGVGAMGSVLTRLLLDKGVEIVGAVGRSRDKVGRDLGEVAGLDRYLGVTIDADPEQALEAGSDIAVVCVSSHMSAMHDHFSVCLKHGINVVTIEEETVYPWTTAPDHANELDALAKANGVTLAASGAQGRAGIDALAALGADKPVFDLAHQRQGALGGRSLAHVMRNRSPQGHSG